MLSPNCIEVERIGELVSLPEGHAARKHVRECPRCRSLWAAYQLFMEAGLTPGADVESARRDLAATIRRKAAEALPAVSPPSTRMSFRARWSGILRPVPLIAAAAVVLVAAAVVWRGGQPTAPVLRGGRLAAFTPQAPEVTATTIHLSWSGVARADAYEVRLFDAELREIYRTGPVTATSVVLDRSALPTLAAGTSLTWRVSALHGGDVIETSSIASVTVP